MVSNADQSRISINFLKHFPSPASATWTTIDSNRMCTVCIVIIENWINVYIRIQLSKISMAITHAPTVLTSRILGISACSWNLNENSSWYTEFRLQNKKPKFTADGASSHQKLCSVSVIWLWTLSRICNQGCFDFSSYTQYTQRCFDFPATQVYSGLFWLFQFIFSVLRAILTFPVYTPCTQSNFDFSSLYPVYSGLFWLFQFIPTVLRAVFSFQATQSSYYNNFYCVKETLVSTFTKIFISWLSTFLGFTQ